MQATRTDVVERTVHIDAKPETVFAYFTDPDRMTAWMARSATLEPHPGGLFRVDYNGFDVMRGEFVEVVPHSRIVATWGWESLNPNSTRPGASTLTVTLEPEGEGTRLHLLHENLGEMDVQGHGQGWDQFLARLAAHAAGRAAADPAPELSRAEEYASRLNSLLCEARDTFEAVPEQKWTVVTSEGRQLNALAQHLVDHVGLVGFAGAVGAGEDTPQAQMTMDKLDAMNAERDRESAGVTRETVMKALLEQGPEGVESVKAMTEAELDRGAAMAFAGGQPVPAHALLEGPLLADIAAHLAHIRAAAGLTSR